MSDKPIVTPTASVLKDDKTVITLATIIGAALVYAIPTLAQYSNVLVFLIAVAGLILVGHQSAEDIITALADYYVTKNGATTMSVTVKDSLGAIETKTVSTTPAAEAIPLAERGG